MRLASRQWNRQSILRILSLLVRGFKERSAGSLRDQHIHRPEISETLFSHNSKKVNSDRLIVETLQTAPLPNRNGPHFDDCRGWCDQIRRNPTAQLARSSSFFAPSILSSQDTNFPLPSKLTATPTFTSHPIIGALTIIPPDSIPKVSAKCLPQRQRRK